MSGPDVNPSFREICIVGGPKSVREAYDHLTKYFKDPDKNEVYIQVPSLPTAYNARLTRGKSWWGDEYILVQRENNYYSKDAGKFRWKDVMRFEANYNWFFLISGSGPATYKAKQLYGFAHGPDMLRFTLWNPLPIVTTIRLSSIAISEQFLYRHLFNMWPIDCDTEERVPI